VKKAVKRGEESCLGQRKGVNQLAKVKHAVGPYYLTKKKRLRGEPECPDTKGKEKKCPCVRSATTGA